MKLCVLKERDKRESRAAISPDAVRKYVALGLEVTVESGAALASGVTDEMLRDAGATIARGPDTACKGADILLTVQRPAADEIALLKKDAILVGMLNPMGEADALEPVASAGITVFAMEFIPRISRAQAMDALSSQSNLAGYRAVIEAVSALGKATPMMMTAAGTVPPAKALILGAGVAGLQAIATARRLGAVVSAFDVRPAVKEQVESLGATFIEVEAEETASAETAGGYAKEMSEDYKRKQAELIHQTLKKQDMVITTALIPGKPAPKLITDAMLKDMKPGAVIVDMATIAGGNVEGSQPDKAVTKHGVTLIGHTNLPARVATDATPLYARNLYNFIALLVDKESGELKPDWDDEIINGALVARDGSIVHPMLGIAKDKKESADG